MRAVNLIPPEEREGAGGVAGRSHGGAYVVLATLVGVALLALLYGRAHRQVASRRTQIASLDARAQQAQAQASGLSAYTSFTALREEREHAVSQLVDSRFDWAHAFHELGRVLPGTASISSIQGAVGSASGGSAAGGSASGAAKASSGVASATPPGSVPAFTLTGCATSQAQVALTLNRLRLIDGVSEVTLQSSANANAGGSGGGGPSGACPATAPAFDAVVTFDPLPATSAVSAAATPAANGGAR
jgi:Tfp pilus assembly protein PilN